MLFILWLLPRLSFLSVAFGFNALLNDVAPVSPVLFADHLIIMKKVYHLWMSFVLFLLSSLFRLSFVSVVFDFNASLNDVAPVSPIQLSVDLMRMERVCC